MLEGQFDAVRARFPGAEMTALPGGATLIRVPVFPVAPGWNRRQTEVSFLAPAGYPYANPDCFWADADLRLESGALPQASNVTHIPETPHVGLWFSWHLTQAWNPNRDCLLTWLAAIAKRFRKAQ